jgi:hypothetical protein
MLGRIVAKGRGVYLSKSRVEHSQGCGGTVELAEEVAKRVWEFFAGKREDKEIETKHIKEKVREELKKKNSRIEESYSSHSKN